MSKTKKPTIIRELKTTKRFDYVNEEVSLGFSLNIDNSSGLRKFRKLLEMAIQDIDEILETMKN